MMEPTGEGQQDARGMDFSAHIFRHSNASYRTDTEILASDNPQAGIDPENQVTPDITEKGIEWARAEAEKFFDGLDPQNDLLFFVSSKMVRAIETANIFRQVAKEKGFQIIAHEDTGTALASEIGEGEIRTLNTLTSGSENALLDDIFNPSEYREPINWSAVDSETRRKWDLAREIIDADDKGSWGANLLAHSEEIKKIFPQVDTAADQFRTKFKNIVRLVRWGEEKASETEDHKNIRVIAFGHEGSLTVALQQYFQENGIKNCEAISFTVDDSDDEKKPLTAHFRGKDAVLS